MAQDITCKQCQARFEATDDDIAFLDKISPVLDGKKYLIPAPKLCHECRQIRRYSWRNERHLYKRTCDLTGEPIISIFSPDKPFKVYSNKAFQSDGWDPLEYGREFDFNRPFFEQFRELLEAVPRQANSSIFNENCDYCNQAWHSKDSYMSFNLGYGERCFYSNESFYVKDCVDTFDIRHCEFSYSLYDCDNCNSCSFLENCKDCSESHFSYDSAGCQNIILSNGLKNKQYYIRNESFSKEDYFEKLKELKMYTHSGQAELKKEYEELKKNAIHRANHNLKSENCTGDYIIESKNCRQCFNIFKSENCVRIGNIDDAGRDSRDMNYTAEMELCYEGASIAGYKNIFGVFMAYGENNYYCNFCEYCKNCFGCVGLRRKEYCIFNKQYTKEEYEQLFAKIIEKMQETGEWGEFFPISISQVAYNESVAQDYAPKTKEEVEAIGGYWQDNFYESEFTGETYEPKDDIHEYTNNEEETKKLLAGVIKCEKSGKPFKILPQEFLFYIKNNIPIPTVHYSERFKELFRLRNPRKLFERQCDCDRNGHGHESRCPNKFETTYSPDREEQVYCEQCYQASIL